MRHILFKEADKYSTAVLVKASTFYKKDITENYITPMLECGVQEDSVIAFSLKYDALGKATASFIKDYLDELLPVLVELGVTHLYVADANYFKVLTKQSKAEPHYGYVLPCQYSSYTHLKVVLGLNYQALIYNPALQDKLNLSIKTLGDSLSSNYTALGSNIVRSSYYPSTLVEIDAALTDLHQYPNLACDLETFSLLFHEAGVGSVSFAWNKHEGVSFLCDYQCIDKKDLLANPLEFGKKIDNLPVKRLLKKFFTEYKGTLTWHNATFDLRVLIYELWMRKL